MSALPPSQAWMVLWRLGSCHSSPLNWVFMCFGCGYFDGEGNCIAGRGKDEVNPSDVNEKNWLLSQGREPGISVGYGKDILIAPGTNVQWQTCSHTTCLLREQSSGLLSSVPGEACSEVNPPPLPPPQSTASPGDGLSLTLKPLPRDLQGRKFHQLPKTHSSGSCRLFFYLT